MGVLLEVGLALGQLREAPLAKGRIEGPTVDESFGSDDFGSLTTSRSRAIPSWITPFRVVVTLAIAGGAIYAYSYSSSRKVSFRVATSKIGSVSQIIESVANIAPSSQSVVDFATSGTVASVPVTVGQSVSMGQTIATLDTSTLNATLQSDNLVLANDQLKLYNDLASQTTTTTTPTTIPSNSGVGSIGQIQSQLNAAEASLAASLSQISSLCSSTSTTLATSSTSVTTQATTTTRAAGSAAPAQGATSTAPSLNLAPTAAKSPSATSCSDAVTAASGASNQVTLLTSSLDKAIASAASSSSTATTGQTNGGSGVGLRGGGATSKPATATQIAVDNANISLAEANVQEATTALGLATLKAPIAGIVASIGVGPGSTVNGTSNTSQFVIIGNGSDYAATFSVSASELPLVHLNQKATVVPDLTMSAITGSITAIGAVTAASSSPSYPVTVTFSSSKLGHLSGDQANVEISVATASNTVVVPTSAVTTNGTIQYVTEVVGSSTKRVPVKVGVVGSIYTQITSGVTSGQEVMLANNSLALPTSSSLTTRFGGFGGGFGGGAGRASRSKLG